MLYGGLCSGHRLRREPGVPHVLPWPTQTRKVRFQCKGKNRVQILVMRIWIKLDADTDPEIPKNFKLPPSHINHNAPKKWLIMLWMSLLFMCVKQKCYLLFIKNMIFWWFWSILMWVSHNFGWFFLPGSGGPKWPGPIRIHITLYIRPLNEKTGRLVGWFCMPICHYKVIGSLHYDKDDFVKTKHPLVF